MITNFKMNKLFQIQQEIPRIKKSSTAKIPTKKGGEFSYDYADINAILDVIRPILSKHKVFIVQPLVYQDGRNVLITRFIDSEDNSVILESSVALIETDDAKDNGGIITYYRRYSIVTSLCLEAEDDETKIPNKSRAYAPVDTSQMVKLKTTWIPDEAARKAQNEKIKKLGGTWNATEKSWYVPKNVTLNKTEYGDIDDYTDDIKSSQSAIRVCDSCGKVDITNEHKCNPNREQEQDLFYK